MVLNHNNNNEANNKNNNDRTDSIETDNNLSNSNDTATISKEGVNCNYEAVENSTHNDQKIVQNVCRENTRKNTFNDNNTTDDKKMVESSGEKVEKIEEQNNDVALTASGAEAEDVRSGELRDDKNTPNDKTNEDYGSKPQTDNQLESNKNENNANSNNNETNNNV